MAATRSEVVRGGGGGADLGARFWARHALTRGAEVIGEPAVPKVFFSFTSGSTHGRGRVVGPKQV
jgi:hypothetical protein